MHYRSFCRCMQFSFKPVTAAFFVYSPLLKSLLVCVAWISGCASVKVTTSFRRNKIFVSTYEVLFQADVLAWNKGVVML